jgi:predicted nucleic acid-binding protein
VIATAAALRAALPGGRFDGDRASIAAKCATPVTLNWREFKRVPGLSVEDWAA